MPDDLPLVLADPALLERVVANLLDNARRHAPAGGAGGRSRPTPADEHRAADAWSTTGPGVAEADRDRMFAPFQRLDDRGGDRRRARPGDRRRLHRGMGGTLEPSTTAGGGLTMTVTLPAGGARP